jgi:DnaJ-class molecular chaperone
MVHSRICAATELFSNKNQERIGMSVHIACFRCKGTGKGKYGPVTMNCLACHGTGSLELLSDEVIDLLKKRLIAYMQQRKVRKGIG